MLQRIDYSFFILTRTFSLLSISSLLFCHISYIWDFSTSPSQDWDFFILFAPLSLSKYVTCSFFFFVDDHFSWWPPLYDICLLLFSSPHSSTLPLSCFCFVLVIFVGTFVVSFFFFCVNHICRYRCSKSLMLFLTISLTIIFSFLWRHFFLYNFICIS